MGHQENQEFLKRFCKPGTMRARVQKSRAVPKEFKLALPPEGRSRVLVSPESERAHEEALGKEFQKLSAKQIEALVGVLVPTLVPETLAALDALDRATYQTNWQRRPFRCPQSNTTLSYIKANWLVSIAKKLGNYPVDMVWVLENAPRLNEYHFREIGWLIAGSLEMGGKAAEKHFSVAREAFEGGSMNLSVHIGLIRGCLSANYPDAWDLMERTLLAAQRQEGLRQSILESIDEAHPEAFLRMLALIQEHNLGRFSSVVRAVDVWFGFLWDEETKWKIDDVVERVRRLLGDDDERAVAVNSQEPLQVYMGLWAQAFFDIDIAVESATQLLKHPDGEIRFAATHILGQSLWSSATDPLIDCLLDDDLRVVNRALCGFFVEDSERKKLVFDRCEALLDRLTNKSTKIPAAIWPWTQDALLRSEVIGVMVRLAEGDRLVRVLPYASELDPDDRARVIRQITGASMRWEKPRKPPRRLESPFYETVLEFLGDLSETVRDEAVRGLESTPVLKEEVERWVDLLRRKASDLRTSALGRLWKLPDPALASVAQTLIEDKLAPRRLAGLELARKAIEENRGTPLLAELGQRYSAGRKSLNKEETAHLAVILGQKSEEPTLDDALGLIDPKALPTWPKPKAHKNGKPTKAAIASLESLCQLIWERREQEVEHLSYDGSRTVSPLLGVSLRNSFSNASELEEAEKGYPLKSVWEEWIGNRGQKEQDKDGLELVRLLFALDGKAPWLKPHAKQLFEYGNTPYYSVGRNFVGNLLYWLIRWQEPNGAMGFALDQLENAAAQFNPKHLEILSRVKDQWHPVQGQTTNEIKARGFFDSLRAAKTVVDHLRDYLKSEVTPEEDRREYAILRWYHKASRAFGRLHLSRQSFQRALHTRAFADEETAVTEFLDLAAGPTTERDGTAFHFGKLRKSKEDPLRDYPAIRKAQDRLHNRIIDIEIGRGDLVTCSTHLASRLSHTGGLHTLRRTMEALGRTAFARGWYSGSSRKEVLSHLVKRSEPSSEETLDDFKAWVADSSIKETKLIELATFAPQWARWIEEALGWKGLEDGVWWLHAHTKDDAYSNRDLQQEWAAEISERTPLSPADLLEGAVDVSWFTTMRKTLGKKRWEALFKAAKFASTSGGHTRALLFASALNGQLKAPEILERMEEKRHQDSVRALGLVPLRGGKQREVDLLRRYQSLMEFKKASRQFGSQRQASEGRAVAIGLENLARTAGYRDPMRLTWAMEKRAVQDLAEGPIQVTREDVTVALSITEEGQPRLQVERGSKLLKNIPKKHGKDPQFKALKERAKDLRKQASRVKDALETSMIRGDTFGPEELVELAEHPILGPGFQRVVFLSSKRSGYLTPYSRSKLRWGLRDYTGKVGAIPASSDLRIAHPADLFESKQWSAWQTECFESGRVQPIKQVFRELYPLTNDETESGIRSKRYAGHQVNPRQAIALLGKRQWVLRPEEGVSRTYHDQNLVARLEFQEHFYTPAEVEGLTLEEVIFTAKGSWKPLPISEVPTRMFSETMRDLDLVVSVAHQGGVDPEASASTIEMRSALLRETAALLGLQNVKVLQHNVLIKGKRAEYSVHLGSAEAKINGNLSLPIVAVHSQHRGRLFLPFADDDPRTAEVLSKVLLLARDEEIKDPTILSRISRS